MANYLAGRLESEHVDDVKELLESARNAKPTPMLYNLKTVIKSMDMDLDELIDPLYDLYSVVDDDSLVKSMLIDSKFSEVGILNLQGRLSDLVEYEKLNSTQSSALAATCTVLGKHDAIPSEMMDKLLGVTKFGSYNYDYDDLLLPYINESHNPTLIRVLDGLVDSDDYLESSRTHGFIQKLTHNCDALVPALKKLMESSQHLSAKDTLATVPLSGRMLGKLSLELNQLFAQGKTPEDERYAQRLCSSLAERREKGEHIPADLISPLLQGVVADKITSALISSGIGP